MPKPYTALVIIDANVTNDWRNEVSAWLVDTGCLVMMAWGNDCSLWDDAVDWANLEKFSYEVPDGETISTTWHENEDIIDVFHAARFNIFAFDERTNERLLILDINDAPRETEIRKLYDFARTTDIEMNEEKNDKHFSKIFKSIKFIQILFFLLFAAGSMFGWHIHTVYRSFLASSPIGEPLFERDLLEDYGTAIIDELASNNVKAAIISRSGQPRAKLPEGVEYTHSAFWLYEPKADGTPYYAVYNLYHGVENRLISSLVKDDPADFLKLTREHDVGIIIPNTETQESLVNYINSPRYGEVHQINYSLISNPFDERYQNCNEFMLDSLAAMMWDTPNSNLIKMGLKDMLKPTELKTSFIREKIGPIIDERLIINDHDGPILTTTRQTLAHFLEAHEVLKKAYVLDLTK